MRFFWKKILEESKYIIATEEAINVVGPTEETGVLVQQNQFYLIPLLNKSRKKPSLFTILIVCLVNRITTGQSRTKNFEDFLRISWS